MNIREMALSAKKAALHLAACDPELKNRALEQIAQTLEQNKEVIIRANQEDLNRSEQEHLAAPLLKRLKFDEVKLADVVAGIRSLIKLEDPVGKTKLATELDQGLELYRVTCPIGVIGIIFESRPDALVQISTLCLKSGNSVLLKGGSEASATNRILTDLIIQATEKAGLPTGWIHLLETRADVNEMLKLDQYIDLIIPRGSNEFVRYIMDNSRIPVMGHADGICHCYVDADADLEMAVRIAVDSKTQYIAVCNAAETLLVHREAALEYLPLLKQAMDEKQVELFGCPKTQAIIDIQPATEKDWQTEYLDYKLAIKVVEDLDEAIEHINHYGSGHTDTIITQNRSHAEKFMNLVDSGNVFWNCSTRFSDGFRYGFGAEVGISTGKLHARGPVGLEGLVSYKYKLVGNGHLVEDYALKKRSFNHKTLKKDCPV
ncbi:MAG: glutamate-5-semialdehyde dehydrogenase [Firmicutes bacterium]|nr:glutamate-5-semialdehyde dehydrogenase [Bacillota bacterium]